MTRYGCLLLGLFLMWAVSTLGQEEALTNPKFDVALGSSFMHFGTASSVNLMGVAISGQCRISNRLGFVGEFDTSYGSGTSARTLLFGPEISLRRRFSPFGHILIGGAHLSHGPASSTSFATEIGGGVDLSVEGKISWSLGEFDYLPTYFNQGRQGNFRLSNGLIFRF
ncbi:MAG: hypothetical protein WB985_04180 [Candidatus Acidiferrales bacterium]